MLTLYVAESFTPLHGGTYSKQLPPGKYIFIASNGGTLPVDFEVPYGERIGYKLAKLPGYGSGVVTDVRYIQLSVTTTVSFTIGDGVESAIIIFTM